jgi:hypothetical protein
MTNELERLRQLARTPVGRAVGPCFAGPRQGSSYQEAVACATTTLQLSSTVHYEREPQPSVA